MSLSQSCVLKLYNSVIEDVISGVREHFLDEGVDDQVLQELKQLWEMKLMQNKAVEPNPELLDPAPPHIGQKSNSKSGGSKKSQAAAQAAAKAAAAAAAAATAIPAAENAADVKVPISQGAGPSNGAPLVQGSSGMVSVQGGSTIVTPSGVSQTVALAQQQLNRLQQQTGPHRSNIQPPIVKNPPTAQPASQPIQQTPQQTLASGGFAALTAEPNRQVPIQITLPPPAGIPDASPRVLTIHVPASALIGNQLQQVLTGPVISATMNLPLPLACSLLQQHVTNSLQGQATNAAAQLQSSSSSQNNGVATFGHQNQTANTISQLDGATEDTSEEEEDDDDDDDDNDDDDENDDIDEDENDENEGGAEEEPLNSGDDVSDEDPQELFDTENVVVCQYDKITRTRNKWKFYLKDGIMNLNGKDFVFQRANGDAEW